MADSKISALSSGAPAQSGDEYVIARSGANYKLTLANMAASMPDTTINGSLVVNEGGADKDTRIEGDTDANLLFVDASTDFIGVGTNTPSEKLDVASGNLVFSGTSQRIKADFGGDWATRLIFQNKNTDAETRVTAMPNGSSQVASFSLSNSSTPTNSVTASLRVDGTAVSVSANSEGAATPLPLEFRTTNSAGTPGNTRMTISTEGNVGIGTASPSSKLSVGGNPPTAGVLAGVSAADSISLALSDNTNNSLYVKHVSGGAATFGTDTGGQLAFATNGFTERMRIDSSGNVGIGTASPTYKLQVQSGASTILAGADANALTLTDATQKVMRFAVPHYTNAEEPVGGLFVSNESASNNILIGGGTGVFNAATRIGFYTAADTTTTTGTERMRIDSSGSVGIGGTANAYEKVQLGGLLPSSSAISIGLINRGTVPSASTTAVYGIANGVSTAAASFTVSNYYQFYAHDVTKGAGSAISNNYGFYCDALTFGTNNFGFYSNIASGSNRWNFYAAGTAQNYFAGNTLVGTTDAGQASGAGVKNLSSGACWVVHSSADSFSAYNTTAAAYRFYVTSGGVINATNGTITVISDQRLKENVCDLDAGLAAVMALKPRKFDWKEGKGKNIKGDRGFIAQEFEQVFPDLVDKWKDPAPAGEEPYKSVRADLIPVLVKAIQELSAKVAALEAK